MSKWIQTVIDRVKSSNTKKCRIDHSSCRCHQFQLKNRLIIFKAHDSRGRRVMYDSLSKKDSTNKCQRTAADSDLIGEMMFGCVPMAQRVSTLKVHVVPNPPQLMVTKVFVPVPCNSESSGEMESFDFYSIQDDDTSSCTSAAKLILSNSLPVSVPRQLSSSYCEDSGLSASASSSMSSLGPSPCGSLTVPCSVNNCKSRRIKRHQATSLEYSAEKTVTCAPLQPLAKRPVKIGVGIILMLDEENPAENERFMNFFFSHIMLIESYVNKLKQSIDEALKEKSQSIIHSAFEKFSDSVYSLYTAPRIAEPVWLDMMTCHPQRSNICSQFFDDLMFFIEKYNTKGTNFFLSRVLTGILTHHLSWTQTVAPVGSGPSKTYLGKSAAKWLNSLGRSHPYNPLWAQLGDLYGAIGFPKRMARTVVVGKNEHLVRRLLNVLSYFIRCSDILESKESFPLPNSALPSPSESTRTVSSNITAEIPDSQEGSKASVSDSQVHILNKTGRVQFSKAISTLEDSISTDSTLSKSVTVRDEGLLTNNETSSGPHSCMFFVNSLPSENCKTVNSDSAHVGENCVRQLGLQPELPVTCDVKSAQGSLPELTTSCLSSSSDSERVLNVNSTADIPVVETSCSQKKQLPCRLSEKNADERVPVVVMECAVRRAASTKIESPVSHGTNGLVRVTLEKPATTMVSSCRQFGSSSDARCQSRPDSLILSSVTSSSYDTESHLTDSNVDLDLKQLRRSPQTAGNSSGTPGVNAAPTFNRGISMFDEYFDGTLPPVELDSFDEVIMNEPCPDVSHIVAPPSRPRLNSAQAVSAESFSLQPGQVLALSITSSSDLVSESNLSNVQSAAEEAPPGGVSFVESHFALGGDRLTDVPDGPSKKMICSAIELMQEVCAADRVALKLEDDIGQADYMRQWASEPADKPTRLVRHRNSSGQVITGSVYCGPSTPSDPARVHRTSTTSSEMTYVESSCGLVELPMPFCSDCNDETLTVPSYDSNLGRSLLRDFCESYQPDFALQGTRDCSFLKDDLCKDLQNALKNSVLDEPIDESSCIVADLDTCSVQLNSWKFNSREMKPQELIESQLVYRILESTQEFRKMSVSTDFCLTHIEDQLQSIYIKSQLLVEYISVHRRLYHQELMALHGFDLGDMPLLLAIASTHSPHLLMALTDCCRG